MRKKTHEEFVEQVRDRDFEVIGIYTGANDKIKFRCKIDGYEWYAEPNNILSGRGCPNCVRNQDNDIITDHGEWLEVDVSTKKHPNTVMKIDKIDYNFIKACGYGRIFAHLHRRTIYCKASRPLTNLQAQIHRLVLPTASIVDHINGEGLDNRFINLRSATSSQNKLNSNAYSNSKSGIKGVSKSGKKWITQIVINGKQMYLGTFDTKEEAGEAYKKASLEAHGEYSYFNREELAV